MPWPPGVSDAVAGLANAGPLFPLAAIEPPCLRCVHWGPVALTNTRGSFEGVRLCHAEEWFRDFSCYTPRRGDGV